MRIPFKKTKGGVTIAVRVRPRSSKKGVEGCIGDVLQVRLTAPPADGEANAQLLEILAEHFGVRRSSLSILRGASSRDKVIAIRGVDEG